MSPQTAAIGAAMPLIIAAAPYTALGALLLAVIGFIIAWRAHARLSKLTLRGTDSLVDTMGELNRRVRELQAFREELEEYLKIAEGRLQKSVRGVGIVRFNPFEGDGSGGNQSFAAAFLDEHGSGVVFSSIHARAGQTSVYAKPVQKNGSEFELTTEEREAIRRAADSSKYAHPSKREVEA